MFKPKLPGSGEPVNPFKDKMTACRITKPGSLIFLLLGSVLALLAGCAAFQRVPIPALPQDLPPRHELQYVPFYPQDAYQCGPATLAMALTWSGPAVTPAELKDQVYTPSRKGSLQLAMVGATRRHGKIAYEISDPASIFAEVAGGQPVIVLQNLGLSWLPVWHYAVVIGYLPGDDALILRSGVSRRQVMSAGRFLRTWRLAGYWGLMVLAPNQMPILAKETQYLAAVLGLEKSLHYSDAVIGYRTALIRWPQSLSAWMGLGNSYYALADLRGAENAFREATQRHPHAAPAYNNLAYVLFKQGRLNEALVAAQKAVDLGGPQQSEAEDTLQEIKSSMP
jgi:hypothetical protein